MVWDYSESNPLSAATGGYEGAFEWVAKVAEAWPGSTAAQAQAADVAEHPLPDQTATVWFTDPPYYFAVPYADLSDFFFVWIKRAMPGDSLSRDPFDPSNSLTPKNRELCEMALWDPNRYAHKDQAFFEDGMARAFAEGRRILRQDGVSSVVFAHKTTEGWEALLSGMIRGGWTITGSWPIATEMGSRLRARESAALATSVHLICRPRPDDAGVFLLRKDSAKALKSGAPFEPGPVPSPQPGPEPITAPEPSPPTAPEPAPGATTKTLRLVGSVPPEVWNRLGTKILPKLRSGSDLRIGLEFTVTVKADTAGSLAAELQQILRELGLGEAMRVEEGGLTSR
jgi:hypothetical protein